MRLPALKKDLKKPQNDHKSAAELGPPTPGWRPLARPRSLFISRRQQIAPPLCSLVGSPSLPRIAGSSGSLSASATCESSSNNTAQLPDNGSLTTTRPAVSRPQQSYSPVGAARSRRYLHADSNRLTPGGLPASLPQLVALRTLWLQVIVLLSVLGCP